MLQGLACNGPETPGRLAGSALHITFSVHPVFAGLCQSARANTQRTGMAKKAIIIGAGPAGLTAGLELLRRTDIVPIIVEASQEIGGISRTIRYKGNRMDIGGHRFFSKSDRVMQWWMELMPPESAAEHATNRT